MSCIVNFSHASADTVRQASMTESLAPTRIQLASDILAPLSFTNEQLRCALRSSSQDLVAKASFDGHETKDLPFDTAPTAARKVSRFDTVTEAGRRHTDSKTAEIGG
ncbi:hypothetical protein DFP72DRAFT_1075694 [Ephemerocybe angulata]|uniref:Uncharacterized protein n=1 Tax=Ephemerocybe angulata TaxID=980116 RepID=A0A8H6LY23_9AGAR|nr:hypothetical protein DFP72DRAFT_1075692 [Tulosesus angulatus]KAF6747050.1 hypothetical protein DFP72DRAFT_1075694 [Tulosesus angulatus]